MAIYPREDPRTTLPQLEKLFNSQLDTLAKNISNRFDGIDTYILNSKETFETTPPIYFKEYDSGLVTIGASTATAVTATIVTPDGYTGYIIGCTISNGTDGSGESFCNPYNYYFNSDTQLMADVRNTATSQVKIHALFTVIWVNKNIVGVL